VADQNPRIQRTAGKAHGGNYPERVLPDDPRANTPPHEKVDKSHLAGYSPEANFPERK